METNMILAGDIGGTKVVLALYETDGTQLMEEVKHSFKSAEYESLNQVVADFLAKTGVQSGQIKKAAFGVAGPVQNGRCEVTNLPWVVDATELASEFDLAEVKLLNDLESIATAVPHLAENDLETLNDGKPVENAPIGVIAPGTGLGEAYLVDGGSGYVAFPSEGGHTDLTANNQLELELLRYMQEKFDHVSLERVASGGGIPNIYNFLRDSGRAAEPDWLKEKLQGVDDPTPVISKHSQGDDAVGICGLTMRTFLSILGAEAGNMALKLLPRGGIYLGGGIPGKILPLLRNGIFIDAYQNKGRMSGLVRDIPLYIINNQETALLGAAWSIF